MRGGRMEIAVFLVCLLLSGFFSGSETALLSAGRLRLRRRADEGDDAAQRVLDLVERPRRLLAGILVGNNIVNVLAASVATLYCNRVFTNAATAATVAVAASTVLLVLFSEFLPKSFAALYPIPFARAVSRPIRLSLILLRPLVLPLELLSRPIGALVSRKRDRLGIAEVRLAVAEGVRTGTVDPALARVLRGGLSLEWKTVGDVLIPRVDVVAVDGKATFDECFDAFREEGFSRLLVMDETPDRDVGYVAAKDLLQLEEEARAGWTARQGARDALRVPHSLPLSELLATMRRSGVHFAVVKDEYGGTEGIVTLEDVIEEVVGEIRDEHDAEELSPVIEIRANLWLVRGDVPVKELNDRLSTSIAAGEARTIAGFVAESLGRVPRMKDTIESAGVRLVVTRIEENRVIQVRLSKLPA